MAGVDTDACLGAAVAAARRIASTAVWHERRCSWLGAMPEEGIGGTIAISFQALGPDLYGGTAGVGLFLAEVAEATGDADIARAARGALAHASSRAGDAAGGLYGGRLGIALALAYGSTLLSDAELDAAARNHADAELDTTEYDLVSGSAGDVVALLALSRLFGRPDLAERAVRCGERLLRQAIERDGTLCWSSPSLPSSGGLAGFSHGAAGAATALLELGEDDAATRAFAYEATLYDEGARNWPDLRTSAAATAAGAPVFVTFWCHGAPGIALSRLRAIELGAGDSRRVEADAALETTERWVAAAARAGTNYSLCHGLAGNAEILREGGRAAALVAAVAEAGIDAYDGRGLPWPSGAHGAPTPGLFLGEAGIGRFYLRLARPELPSLLLVRPESFARS